MRPFLHLSPNLIFMQSLGKVFSISSLGSEYESNFPKLCINIRLGLECKKGFYLYNLYVFFDLPKFNLLQMFLILSTK